MAERLVRALGRAGVVREVGSIAALHCAAEDFLELEIDVLAISGGDGTNGVTISGFVDVYGNQALPKICLLRGGTANTVADSIRVRRRSPDRLLAGLIEAKARSRPLRNIQRPVMRVSASGVRRSDGTEIGPSSHGFLFGVGVVCGYLTEYYASGEPSPRVAAKTLLRGIGSSLVGGPMVRRMARPFRGSVHFEDGTAWEERDYLAVAAGTIDHIGLGAKPFYRAGERTDAFHALGIYTRPLGFIRQLDRVWAAREMRPGHAYEHLASQMRIESSARPLAFMLDGDLYQCDGSLEVTVGPVVTIVVAD